MSEDAYYRRYERSPVYDRLTRDRPQSSLAQWIAALSLVVIATVAVLYALDFVPYQQVITRQQVIDAMTRPIPQDRLQLQPSP